MASSSSEIESLKATISRQRTEVEVLKKRETHILSALGEERTRREELEQEVSNFGQWKKLIV